MNNSLKDLKGVTFPLRLDSEGKIQLSVGKDVIKSSIINLLSWPAFTRYFQLAYGSRVEELLEEPNDYILISLIKTFIIEAISKWEPRIIYLKSDISRDSTTVKVNVTYQIKTTNLIDSVDFIITNI
jgi:uncharacterized protein